MPEPQAITQTVEIMPDSEEISFETGRLAKQADGSVVVRRGGTMVLCTAVIEDEASPEKGFFPLTVDYREKFAAGGRIPGGFMKREGRPNDKETLSSRLIDRAIRPLFPDGFYHQAHVIAYVLSADPEHDADVLAGTGASAALMMAGAPFDGPFAEVRVGRVDGEYVINPTIEQVESSDIDLIVAGKEDAITMVEGEMDEVSEDEMLEALDAAHDAIRPLCQMQHRLVEQGDVTDMDYETITVSDDLVDEARDAVGDQMADHIRDSYDKDSFYGGVDDLKDEAAQQLLGDADETPEGYTEDEIRDAVSKIESESLREMILADGKRLDGRGHEDIRDLWMEAGTLPRVHGSAVFTRGETQVLGSITLGSSKDVQPVDQVFDEEDKPFFLHYRFPPFCVGEASYLRGPKRREIGHSMLAERALEPVIPSKDDFPYTIRINAEVLESNGSSSMASVCAGTLALMDAGAPIEKPVAGIAMGLVQEGDDTAILTDILGTEDHLGDMDFKITGTRDGITACQMDIKISGGLSRDLLKRALNQSSDARGEILDAMHETMPEPSAEMSEHAPRLTKVTIDAEHIGAVIGPGGSVIKSLERDTNTSITIDEEEGLGHITISATNARDADAAINRIKQLVAEPEEGETYEGTVQKIVGFGAFVEIMPGKDGLLHISEIDHGYVEEVSDHLQVGDKIKVRLLEVRDDGKLRLSRKPFLDEESTNGQQQ
jgi:polyribonucleotide nucleotidyltransferase